MNSDCLSLYSFPVISQTIDYCYLLSNSVLLCKLKLFVTFVLHSATYRDIFLKIKKGNKIIKWTQLHSRGPHAVPVPHFENPSLCRCVLCLLTNPKLCELLLPGKRPGDGITHSRHNVSIRYYQLVIREQRLVNRQSRTRI